MQGRKGGDEKDEGLEIRGTRRIQGRREGGRRKEAGKKSRGMIRMQGRREGEQEGCRRRKGEREKKMQRT